MAHDVFISCSSTDKPTADAACAVLESKDIRCWIAPRDILPGSDWGESIIDAINGAKVMVLIFSGHANQSAQIKREVERAIDRAMPIIPVRIQDVQPAGALEYFLSTPHWLDAFMPPLEQHLEYLAATVKQILTRSTELPRRSPLPGSWWPQRTKLIITRAVITVGLLVLAGLSVSWLVRNKDGAAADATKATEASAAAEGGKGSRGVAPVPLSNREQSLPAGRVLKVIYQSMPPAPAELVGPLSMQVGVYSRRASDKSYRPLIDGDELASQVDRYWLGVRPLTVAYLYVIQVDTRGNADWLFPANKLRRSLRTWGRRKTGRHRTPRS